MTKSIVLSVNGREKTIFADPEEPLLYILREEFGLNGPKFGCGLHQCGSCMVLSDGQANYTCRIPCSAFEGKKIETIEGLAQDEKLHPLQQSFFDEQAAQCGYCLNGMLINALELLRKKTNPSEEEIRDVLHKVICRCGTHSRFIKAVKKAVDSRSKF
ncbi:(2Fe-2S)-binding protein [Cecembia calidifontis]|jgi:nicotinate dehydrogenase subunit A|uniref:Nicotinate dehydrogenase subunit A n=1 Tax=Cecembia calidifontis TaxID=1187080 RepID=A0A4Q7P4H6_9BACT|nr:(2Fe-2S)-binding protein [Cecembia calidifontis]RZS94567.1 nicotinate dehydrogenase subunit A [Cecembia calidifontis]